ncbi:hypothetical protein EDD17DRAFT_1503891 [Pisolithus thermaeus]|nr:hypothetical protein EV401DRAFT_1890556 [Pisolithus croceorrhizus]KAI6167625.1 hypothetical protein EDD17DRAFT_1503891 [Pisolithus thermaeus]
MPGFPRSPSAIGVEGVSCWRLPLSFKAIMALTSRQYQYNVASASVALVTRLQAQLKTLSEILISQWLAGDRRNAVSLDQETSLALRLTLPSSIAGILEGVSRGAFARMRQASHRSNQRSAAGAARGAQEQGEQTQAAPTQHPRAIELNRLEDRPVLRNRGLAGSDLQSCHYIVAIGLVARADTTTLSIQNLSNRYFQPLGAFHSAITTIVEEETYKENSGYPVRDADQNGWLRQDVE